MVTSDKQAKTWLFQHAYPRVVRLYDQHDNVAALHGYNCSVYTRHQKIIEEEPNNVAPQKTIKRLEQATSKLRKLINYVAVETVEYFYSMETEEYYFLDLNPRLQIDHTVTDWISEINLPVRQVHLEHAILFGKFLIINLMLENKTGRRFNSEACYRREYCNLDFLLHAVIYQAIDQIGCCFTEDVFDPHGYDK